MVKKPLEWTRRAQSDRQRIAEFYAEEASPLIAIEALTAIRSAADRVRKPPLAYRTGKRAGTRELVMRRFPYVLIYRIQPNSIVILRVLHQSMRYFN